MIRFNKALMAILFLFLIALIVLQFTEATTMNFTVTSGEEETKSLNLVAEDHVVIRFSIVGQSDNTLLFFITCPNGTLWTFGKVGTFNYPFVCNLEGEYILHFSNQDSLENKLVTLDYEVEHYILGMPQMLFLTLIILTVCLAAVAVFIYMGKAH